MKQKKPQDQTKSLLQDTKNPAMEEKEEKIFFSMGTIMGFLLHGPRARETLKAAEAITVKLDSLLSRKKADSEISLLNRSPGQWIRVQKDTDMVLREALRYAEQTGGRYEPCIGSLVDLWESSRKEKKLPGKEAITQALACCDYRSLQRDRRGRYRLQKGAGIDLGGIGKGYAADRVAALCRKQGVSSALFSFGSSSIAAVGTKPDGSPWRVGLKTADSEQIRLFGVVRLKNQFLSTSGDYEKSFQIDGHRYHHILETSTGYPADNGLRSVTVIAESGAKSEAYSTALFVMGLEKALDFYKCQGGFEAIFFTSDQRIVCTPGARELFERKEGSFSSQDMQREGFRR